MSIFLIAEAGVNHGGSITEALKLADAAKHSGADAVKYQFFNSRRLWGDDRIKDLELTAAEMELLHKHCERIGIEFMCTPFGVEELQFLAPLLKRIKIASGCIDKEPLLRAARLTKLPVVISTGMSAIPDIWDALSHLGHGLPAEYGDRPITLLHCTSSYPCRLEDVNLKAMSALRHQWGDRCPIGYSDHTNGITVAIAAAALGATVIEKHLTLDRNLPGPDHKASINPREFKALRLAIIEVEAMLGDGVKRVLDCEQPLRKAWRRS